MHLYTGDTHGEGARFYAFETADGKRPQKGDILFITGDAGLVFWPEGTAGYYEAEKTLKEIASLPYTVCFVDGNHENFDRLYAYPKKLWNGGYVHEIAPNILHLMRGEVYDIDGKRYFVMGGAYSIDKYMRHEGLSWWRAELPSEAEYKNAERNLKDVGMRVDVILSHQAPREIIRRMGRHPDAHDMELTGFLEWVMYEVSYDKWYFGHWHGDKQIDEKHRLLWFDTVSE